MFYLHPQSQVNHGSKPEEPQTTNTAELGGLSWSPAFNHIRQSSPS